MQKNEAKSAELNAAIKDKLANQLTDLYEAFSYIENDGEDVVIKNYLNVELDTIARNQVNVKGTKKQFEAMGISGDEFIDQFAIQFAQDFTAFVMEEGIRKALDSNEGVTIMHSGVYYDEIHGLDLKRSEEEKNKDKEFAGMRVRTVEGNLYLVTDMSVEGFKKTVSQITIGGDFISLKVYEDDDDIVITTLGMEKEAVLAHG